MKWIKPTEELPQVDEQVLICTNRPDIFRIAYYEKDGIFHEYWAVSDDTEWEPECVLCWARIPQIPQDV